MSEINPNHPVVREVHDHWHKIVGVLMLKFGVTDVEITPEDVIALGNNENAVVFDTRGGECHVRVMPMAEGMRLAREAGGLPV